MNPVIIIPTYVCANQKPQDAGVLDTYDHMTPLSRDGELVRCLSSIRNHGIDVPIAILVLAESGSEEAAQEKIRRQAAHYPELRISVIGSTEEKALHDRMKYLGIGEVADGIGLVGYSASKNLGLIYAANMGYDEAIFIDDDEVIEDDDFMDKACYGLGMLTQRGVPILIKTGFYLDKNGSYKANVRHRWYDHFWQQHEGFNQWIEKAMSGPRLSSSNTAYAGLLAIHREAFRRVSFDPWISRGEDLDFLFNVRMYGSEVWFDNMWSLRHLPPPTSKYEARRFTQDIYRWFYEKRKLEFSSTQIDLLQIQPKSLEPYPAPFLDSSIRVDTFMTALLRTIGRKGQRRGYFNAAAKARKGAREYAKENCACYFSFQRKWPEVMAMLEEDMQLRGVFENAWVEPMTEEQIASQDSKDTEARIMARIAQESQEASDVDGSDNVAAEGAVESQAAAEHEAGRGRGRFAGDSSMGRILRDYTERKNLNSRDQ